MNTPLEPGEADEVLRRAAELSSVDPLQRPGYDRGSLAEAASEVGIELHAVELALAEHDTGLLRRGPGRNGLLGPSRVVASRAVPHDVASTRRHVQRWLRAQLLVREERRGTAEIWRPRDDLAAKVRRKVDAKVTRRVRIGDVDAVEVSVAAAGEGSCVIRLEAVFDDMRRGLRTGVVVIPAAAAPVLGVVGAVLTSEVLFLLGAIPIGGALGGLGTYAGRRTLADGREQARRALCSFLDQLDDD